MFFCRHAGQRKTEGTHTTGLTNEPSTAGPACVPKARCASPWAVLENTLTEKKRVPAQLTPAAVTQHLDKSTTGHDHSYNSDSFFNDRKRAQYHLL